MQKKTKHSYANGGVYPSGRKSRNAFITINTKYGRIYFSAFAVRIFDLVYSGFEIFDQDGSWFFKLSGSLKAKKLTTHRYAFYFVDRTLVGQLISSFPGEGTLRLNIEDAQRKAPKYLLTRTGGLPGDTTGNKTSGSPKPTAPIPVDTRASRDEVSRAIRTLASYVKTDFIGRVKTTEVIQAERIIVNAKQAL